MMKFVTSSFYENLKMALDTLRGNKLRSFLTIIGVVVGVITVMLISSIISGINVAVEKQVESFGTRSIFLYKYNIGIQHRHAVAGRADAKAADRSTTPKRSKTYRRSKPPFRFSMFQIISSGRRSMVTGKNGKTSSAVQLQGTLPEIEKTTTEVLLDGRWFSQSESDEKANVCLIGSSVVDSYFPFGSTRSAKRSRSAAVEFRVIGVLEKREQLFGGGGGNNDQSNVIYMPMGAALKLKPNADDLFILAVAKEGMLEKAKDDVQDLCASGGRCAYGKPNNFSMETAARLSISFRRSPRALHRDGRDFVGRPDDRRDRRDEHHAGFGDRTNARDRHPQSDRREAERYLASVSDRGRDADRIRRACRTC